MLKRSEKEFLESTPSKIIRQIEIHSEFVSNSKGNSENNRNKNKFEKGIVTSQGFYVSNR